MTKCFLVEKKKVIPYEKKKKKNESTKNFK